MFAGQAFGADAGNQFAGGGFMPSQANDTGYGGSGGGSGGGKRGTSAHTLRTVTIRQLAKDLANLDDDTFVVDGTGLDNLTVLGKIMSVQDRSASLVMVLNDGTGEMELNHWLQEDTGLAAQSKKAELRVGVYVKAHGHLSRRDGKVTMTAFTVRPVTNFNELTYHGLRTIFEHLHLTKGGAGGGQQAAAGGGGGGAGAGFGAPPAAGGWQQGGLQQQQPHMGGAGAVGYAGAGGADPCQSAVLQIIRNSNDDQGVDQTQIYNMLGGQFGAAAIDNALQALTAEAHIFNTVDDNHWKAT